MDTGRHASPQHASFAVAAAASELYSGNVSCQHALICAPDTGCVPKPVTTPPAVPSVVETDSG